MTRGSCDPSPEPFNVTELSKDDGRVTFTCRWSWDGESVYPDCVGPIFDVRVQNSGPNVWILSLPSGQTQKTVKLNPGTDQTYSGAQLATIGLLTVSDINGLTLTLAR